MPHHDAEFLHGLLDAQSREQHPYELSSKDKRALNRATVRTSAGELPVKIPDEEDEAEALVEHRVVDSEIRQSHEISPSIQL
jgi:hypothetical protein